MHLPNELIDLVFLYSNYTDIQNWRCLMHEITFLKKKECDIYQACKKGNLVAVKYFVENHYGNKISGVGATALKWSIENHHLHVVQYLINKGMKIHKLSVEWSILVEALEIQAYLDSL